jgi:hypothetical protein
MQAVVALGDKQPTVLEEVLREALGKMAQLIKAAVVETLQELVVLELLF